MIGNESIIESPINNTPNCGMPDCPVLLEIFCNSSSWGLQKTFVCQVAETSHDNYGKKEYGYKFNFENLFPL